tara:strand:+ start:163 stop:1860 length:1698 start_codon:yes stop_codon:yes gene_type:complete
MKYVLPVLMMDFYKTGHIFQYPKNTEVVYSTWTPRSNRYFPQADKVVSFGQQGFNQEWLIEFFNDNFFNKPIENVLHDYCRVIKNCLGIDEPDSSHIEALHDLGYLPIMIKSLPEGTLCPIRVPMLTIENTIPEFFWLTNALETLMSGELWIPQTSATIARHYRGIMEKWAMKTVGNVNFVPFQGHDFSMRGMEMNAGAISGTGHLTSFVGTDTIPAVMRLEEYYGADIERELVGCSVAATEHSVMCAGGKDDELETYRRLIEEVYPTGIVSIVSDTWDFWNTLTNILPQLKEKIMARDGKVVIRPDSGDPVDIICGLKSHEYEYDDLSDMIGEMVDLRDEGDFTLKFKDKCYQTNMRPIINEIDDHGSDGFWNVGFNLKELIRWGILTEIEVDCDSPAFKGTIELLWEVFGGTVNELGYKELDSHIGAIYGDAITPERCEEICRRLEAKGFASTNIVFGIGSFTYQYNTRDTFGFALKSTYVEVDGEARNIFKDPITDDGTKKSQTGMVGVVLDDKGDMVCVDGLSMEEEEALEGNLLETIFVNGIIMNRTTLSEIRTRLEETK